MRLRRIEVFHAVYVTGSVSGGARALNVSQPTVSKVLKHAEDQLGFELFDRISGRLIPSEKGVKLFEKIEPLFEQLNELTRFTTLLRNSKGEHLRFAMTPAFGLEVGPMALAAFSKAYSDITIEAETLHANQAAKSLLNLAARAEDYSDVGSVVKPKIAASWFPFEQLQIRGAYAEGFRAPNSEQINATEIRRVNTGREDWILCEALQRADDPTVTFTRDDLCDSVGVEGARGGGPDLKPETNKNFSIGATFELSDYLTLTADWWRIEQNDIVGLFSDQNEISLDYALRLEGSSNPNVIRSAPDAELAALFESVGLAGSGAGEILEVNQRFRNLNPRTSEGLDIGGQLRFDTDFGRFRIKANAAQIREFFQSPSSEGQQLIDAVNSGSLNPLVDVVGQQSLIQENGNPEWRYTGSIRWDEGAWGLGAFYKYVGDVRDTSVTGTDYDFLEIPAFKTLNLYGDYTFEDESYGIFDNVRLRLGVRNVGDKKPPIADEFARGYFVSLHSNRGRYWYGSVRKTF